MWTRKRPANWPRNYANATVWEAQVSWITASRQAVLVEWGMRALRSRWAAWARLNAPMPNNSEERADLLELVALLHNAVLERIGANQIRSVYFEGALRHSDGFIRRRRALRRSQQISFRSTCLNVQWLILEYTITKLRVKRENSEKQLSQFPQLLVLRVERRWRRRRR